MLIWILENKQVFIAHLEKYNFKLLNEVKEYLQKKKG